MADVDAVTTFYGRLARAYDLVATRTPGITSLRRRAVAALDLRAGDTVVEMGCGTGANLPYLREQVGPEGCVVGIDLTPGMLARASHRVTRNGWRNVHLVRGDAGAPPVDRADAVLATFVVGMLPDPTAAVGRWEALAPGGRVALVDATRSSRRSARPLNGVFRAFVALTTPPIGRLRYDESPAAVLDRRVADAHEALVHHGTPAIEESLVFGFVRLTAATATTADTAAGGDGGPGGRV